MKSVLFHVHERVDPATILANAAKRLKGKDAATQWQQPDMFAAPFENLPLRQALDFYHHEKGWSNRLVAGDSLLVMNSLLTKESMGGNPIGATGQMRTWYTTKPCFPMTKSHISHLVGNSSWEGHAANVFEKRDDVLAYAKNDHLGFQVYYMWAGSRRRYLPDFLVRLSGETLLALEIKGTDSPPNKAKRDALDEWVRAVNAAGGFGRPDIDPRRRRCSRQLQTIQMKY